MKTKRYKLIGLGGIAVAASLLYLLISGDLSPEAPAGGDATPVAVQQEPAMTASNRVNADSVLPLPGIEKLQALERQIAALETRYRKVESQLEAAESSAQAEADENIDELLAQQDYPDADEMTPEWIAEQDMQQNAYVDGLAEVYYAEGEYTEWSQNTESEMTVVLSSMDQLVQDPQNVVPPYSGQPDIALDTFSCRKDICEASFTAGSMQELIRYQGFLIEKTASVLPNIIFSAEEEVGGRYRMRAFLATDDFEFPKP